MYRSCKSRVARGEVNYVAKNFGRARKRFHDLLCALDRNLGSAEKGPELEKRVDERDNKRARGTDRL